MPPTGRQRDEMGIDLFSITFELERSCGVKIDVKDIAVAAGRDVESAPQKDLDLTVAQIHAFLLERRNEIKTVSAQRPQVEERVRQVLRTHFLDDRRDPDSDEHLEDIVPRVNRRRHWSQLAEMLNSKLPLLELPWSAKVAASSALFALVLGITLAGWRIAFAIDHIWIGSLIISVGWLAGVFAASELLATGLQTWRRQIPQDAATVGRLADYVTVGRLAESDAPLLTMSDDEVFTTLRDVLVEVLVIEPDAVTPEAKLVADLGMS